MRINVPLTGADELAEIAPVLESGYLTQGPKAAEFEQAVASYVGAQFGFATSSATTGLHLALHAVGVGPGDEVVIPDYSFPATANVVVERGAKPIFVDIDEATFNLNANLLDSVLNEKTKAIMPVHAFGLPADMDPINAIGKARGIPVIEDAACALSAEYKGRMAGNLADAGVFSFHPRKIITTGEGGLIATNSPELAEKVSVLRTHGGVRGEYFLSFVDAGYNYRLSDVLAAIGIAQMRKLATITDQRQSLAARLTSHLTGLDGVTPPTVPHDRRHSFQSYVVMLDDSIDRDGVIGSMSRQGIETTLGTYALHLQPYFRERFAIADERLPVSTRAHSQALTLPLYPGLKECDLERIAVALQGAVASNSRG